LRTPPCRRRPRRNTHRPRHCSGCRRGHLDQLVCVGSGPRQRRIACSAAAAPPAFAGAGADAGAGAANDAGQFLQIPRLATGVQSRLRPASASTTASERGQTIRAPMCWRTCRGPRPASGFLLRLRVHASGRCTSVKPSRDVGCGPVSLCRVREAVGGLYWCLRRGWQASLSDCRGQRYVTTVLCTHWCGKLTA
jgi:hypothetical protein